jgi:hypothetical protein
MEVNMFGWNSTVDDWFNYNEGWTHSCAKDTITAQRRMIERLETANAQTSEEIKKQLAEIKQAYSFKIEEKDKRGSDLMKQLEKNKEESEEDKNKFKEEIERLQKETQNLHKL